MKWTGAAALLCLVAAGCAATDVAREVQSAVTELVATEALAGGRVGVVVLAAESGDTLAEHAGDRGFATASNMKLLSSAVALQTLGEQFTTTTDLVARGEVRDGVLLGDVVLRGHGDPTFGEGKAGDAALLAFVEALQQMGVKSIRGRVLGDGSWQGEETLGLGWQWDYLDEDYAAPFGGLCMAGNVVTVRVRPGTSGPELRVLPVLEHFPTVAVTQGAAGSKTALVAHRVLGSDEIVVRGTIAADAKEQVLQVAVRDPAVFAAAAFLAVLRDRGIGVEGASVEPAGPERVVASHTSPALAAILRPLLTHSNNLYAEQVWRLAARVAVGDASTAAAERHARSVLGGLGVDTAGMVLADGSGLSRRNLVQPRQIARLLVAMHASPHREAFVAGLPVAGQTGTLRSRFAEGPARGHVQAKTGYISRVVCLSGFVHRQNESEPPLVFSVMLNDFTCEDALAKAAVDAFVQRLARAAGW
jgi:D-alanyl-D-alanine carboxypeptidase/D-alanyl-D-alanine-endopeptidase (penicillin-binding protein 4)